jgi:coenzyme F420-0:L-glutamate ligase/coenzyme F420-1:gamma-L-glutamate ligase
MEHSINFLPLTDLPDFTVGMDLPSEIMLSLHRASLQLRSGDVLVVAQKVVSKVEGRRVDLSAVQPSERARELALKTGKDARLVELILLESQDVVRVAPNILIVRHRLGYVMANAGIDRSNVAAASEGEFALLLPRDPDASAATLRKAFQKALGVSIGVIISDSFGRPWRNGVVNVALGAAGLPTLVDRRGELDRYGRKLEMTEVAFGDAIAAGAALAMGEGAEGTPVVVVRGLSWRAPAGSASDLIRPKNIDLFK